MRYKVQTDNGTERVDCYMEGGLLVGLWFIFDVTIELFDSVLEAQGIIDRCSGSSNHPFYVVPEDTPEQREAK